MKPAGDLELVSGKSDENSVYDLPDVFTIQGVRVVTRHGNIVGFAGLHIVDNSFEVCHLNTCVGVPNEGPLIYLSG